MLVISLFYTLMINESLLGYCYFYCPKSIFFMIPLLGAMNDVNLLLYMLLTYVYDAG